jgi:hypothetical protein
VHTCRMNEPSHNVTICPSSNQLWTPLGYSNSTSKCVLSDIGVGPNPRARKKDLVTCSLWRQLQCTYWEEASGRHLSKLRRCVGGPCRAADTLPREGTGSRMLAIQWNMTCTCD